MAANIITFRILSQPKYDFLSKIENILPKKIKNEPNKLEIQN
jgi:hypothetical protein